MRCYRFNHRFSTGLLAVVLTFNLNCYSVKDEKKEIKFYYRYVGSTNYYKTYMDEFKITNYQNKTVLASELLKFAEQYIDSMNTATRVSGVSFVGEKYNQQLPEEPGEDPFNTEQKQSLIAFDFSNFMEENKDKKPELYDISISRNGKGKVYYLKFPKDKRIIDSVLNSKEPFDNNF